jgi:transcriptional regulator with XRE-family HTH domain
MVEACNRLREVREDRGLTRAELATRVGVAPSTVAQFENPTRSLRGETLRKLATALNCSPKELIP